MYDQQSQQYYYEDNEHKNQLQHQQQQYNLSQQQINFNQDKQSKYLILKNILIHIKSFKSHIKQEQDISYKKQLIQIQQQYNYHNNSQTYFQTTLQLNHNKQIDLFMFNSLVKSFYQKQLQKINNNSSNLNIQKNKIQSKLQQNNRYLQQIYYYYYDYQQNQYVKINDNKPFVYINNIVKNNLIQILIENVINNHKEIMSDQIMANPIGNNKEDQQQYQHANMIHKEQSHHQYNNNNNKLIQTQPQISKINNKNTNNTPTPIVLRSKRNPQKSIQQAFLLVSQWRTLYRQGTYNENGKKIIKINLDQAAQIVNIPRKTLEDYYLLFKKGMMKQFQFKQYKKEKIGKLRAFLRERSRSQKDKQKAQQKMKKVNKNNPNHTPLHNNNIKLSDKQECKQKQKSLFQLSLSQFDQTRFFTKLSFQLYDNNNSIFLMIAQQKQLFNVIEEQINHNHSHSDEDVLYEN